ncbi:MAG: hypothetical protein IJB59_02660 [Oscillospiraceae bacterium]|nr:hypothetical protein [Oscillospiraceae bacterium]
MNNYKRIQISLLFSLTFCSMLLCSCSVQTNDTPQDSTNRKLTISAVADSSAGFTTIAPESLGGNFEEDIVYLNLTDVTVTVAETAYPLEEAIRDGHITVEEIFAYARIDARNGICKESHTTRNGLTVFTYAYPEFDLSLTYDVYETPDGKQHLINDMGIYNSYGANVVTIYEDEETGERIDRENWGLTFTVTDANADCVTLECTQTGGQHIGDLRIYSFVVYRDGEKYSIPDQNGEYRGANVLPEILIPNETTSTVTLNWQKELGSLSPGSYRIFINIHDIYDITQVHPLMKDFQDVQQYRVEFTIS